jgi:hypothetical protein
VIRETTRLIILDKYNRSLYQHPFSLSWTNSDGQQQSRAHFNIKALLPGGAVRAEIRHGAKLLWAANMSEHAPDIQLSQPVAGTYTAEAGVPIQWTVRDTDRDQVALTLEYSKDGTNWLPAGKLTDASYRWIPSFPKTTNTAQVRVRASDGFNVAYATSPRFKLVGRPPMALILQPAEGEVFVEGQKIKLEGDSLTSLGNGAGTFTWKLDGQALGSGRDRTLTLDLVGGHTISLTVATGGQSHTASVHVTVLKDYDSAGMPNDWELSYKLNPMDASDAPKDTDGDGLTNLEEYQLGTDPTKADTEAMA